jgi:hypothetical protein
VSLVIEHVQSRVVDTVIDPLPPDASNEAAELETFTAHRLVLGAVTDVEVELQRAASSAQATAIDSAETAFPDLMRSSSCTRRCTRLANTKFGRG